MTAPAPIEKQFGGDIGERNGRDLLQKTITGTSYQAIPKAIAQDFDALFKNLSLYNGALADPMLIARLQGYLKELSMAVGLMAAILQESGFQITTTPSLGGDKLSIQKKGGQL